MALVNPQDLGCLAMSLLNFAFQAYEFCKKKLLGTHSSKGLRTKNHLYHHNHRQRKEASIFI